MPIPHIPLNRRNASVPHSSYAWTMALGVAGRFGTMWPSVRSFTATGHGGASREDHLNAASSCPSAAPTWAMSMIEGGGGQAGFPTPGSRHIGVRPVRHRGHRPRVRRVGNRRIPPVQRDVGDRHPRPAGAAPKLVLCRDHFGIKPVYWARSGDRLLFASEIQGAPAGPVDARPPNDQRILDYLVTGIPRPHKRDVLRRRPPAPAGATG